MIKTITLSSGFASVTGYIYSVWQGIGILTYITTALLIWMTFYFGVGFGMRVERNKPKEKKQLYVPPLMPGFWVMKMSSTAKPIVVEVFDSGRGLRFRTTNSNVTYPVEDEQWIKRSWIEPVILP
jgi:hypothetical protein